MQKNLNEYVQVDEYGYNLIDRCRDNLTKYTAEALSRIPVIYKPLILDLGCGSGVPTVSVLKHYPDGHVYAVDSDQAALSRLEQKVKRLGYSDRIDIIKASVFDMPFNDLKFDIILAEGLLNVIGFETGLTLLSQHLKPSGYLVIHDELHKDAEKRELLKDYHLELIETFVLDENIWWNDYYAHVDPAVGVDSSNESFRQ